MQKIKLGLTALFCVFFVSQLQAQKTFDPNIDGLPPGQVNMGANNTWNLDAANWYQGGANTNYVGNEPEIIFGTITGGGSGNQIVIVEGAKNTVSLMTVGQTPVGMFYTFTGDGITGTSLAMSNTNGVVFDNNVSFGTSTAGVAGAITIGTGAGNGSITGNINLSAAGSSLIYNRTGSLSYGNVISGAGSLVKNNSLNLTLSNTNTFTGGTTINAGTLTLGHATNTLANSGAVDVAGGVLAIGNNSDTVGAITLSSGSITGTGGVLTGSSYAVTNSSGSTNISAALGGSVSLTKSGAGNLNLTGANTYTGGTTVNAGTVTLGASNVLANSGAVTVAGGTLAIGTNSDTVGALILSSGSITGSTGVLSASSVSVTNNSGTTTVSAILGGSSSLTKTGAGTLQLSAANTYTGGTNVSAGTVVASLSSSIGTGNVNIEEGATLQIPTLNISGTQQLSGEGNIDGNLSFNGAGGALLVLDPTITTTLDLSKILNVTGTMSFTDFTLMNLSGLDLSSLAEGIYTLISGGTSVTFNGNSSTITNQYAIGNGKFGYFQQGSLDLIITAVPEPSSLMLLTLVGGVALCRRSRRSK